MRALIPAMAILMAGPVPADAYCLNWLKGYPDPPAWTKEVAYHVSDNLTDPDLLAAIDAAFAAWDGVDCSTLAIKKGGTFKLDSMRFQTHRNYGIYVFFYDKPDGYPTEEQFATFSSIGFDVSGEITEASIAINAFAYKWDTKGQLLDMQGEMMRLIGAAIGLNPSNVTDSVMHEGGRIGNIEQRQLREDDIAALQYLYYTDGCSLAKTPSSSTRCTDDGPAPGGSTPPSTTSPPTEPQDDPPSTSSSGNGSPGPFGTGSSSGCALSGATDAGAAGAGLILLGLLLGCGIARSNRRRQS